MGSEDASIVRGDNMDLGRAACKEYALVLAFRIPTNLCCFSSCKAYSKLDVV